MIMADGFLTASLWLAYNLYTFIADYAENRGNKDDIFTTSEVLRGLLLTNVFSAPIVYFVMNKDFRVSFYSKSY